MSEQVNTLTITGLGELDYRNDHYGKQLFQANERLSLIKYGFNYRITVERRAHPLDVAVLMDRGGALYVGFASCDSKDIYCKRTGRSIAIARALKMFNTKGEHINHNLNNLSERIGKKDRRKHAIQDIVERVNDYISTAIALQRARDSQSKGYKVSGYDPQVRLYKRQKAARQGRPVSNSNGNSKGESEQDCYAGELRIPIETVC